MKKICKCILLIIICGFLFVSSCKAESDELLLKSMVYVKHTYKFGNTTRTMYFNKNILKSSKNQIYNFNMPLNQKFLLNDIYEKLPNTVLDKETLSRIREIVYYGDKLYNETKDDLYYIVTQGLMIKALKPSKFLYLENSNYSNETILQAENLLKKEIDEYFLKPSFDDQELELNLNEEITITDTNNILTTFFLDSLENDNVSFKIVDNKIILKALKPGKVTLKLKKEFKDKDDNMKFLFEETDDPLGEPLYFAITPGNFTNYVNLNILVNASRIGLNVKDDKSIFNSEQLNATYGIYNQKDELVYQIHTNVEGLFYTDYLPYGKYYVKEISNSDIYQKNKKIYNVELKSEQGNIIEINNYKKSSLSDNEKLKDNIKNVTISFLDEEGRLINDDIDISIVDKFYQINGKISLILKDGNYVMNILNIPEDYVLEDKTKILNITDNMDIKIVLKHKEEGFGNEVVDEVANISVPDTFSFNYLFIFIGLRYVKKFNKW